MSALWDSWKSVWRKIAPLLRRAMPYVVLSAAAVLGYGLLVGGSSLILGEKLPANNPFLIGLMIFLLALTFDPLRAWLQREVDAIFFRGEAIHRERLQSFGRQLTEVTDPTSILRILRQAIAQSLVPQHLHIFLYEAASGYYRAAADEEGETTSDLRFEADSPLSRLLASRKSAVFLGEDTLWPTLWQAERARVALLGTSLFVPLPGRERLTGWLALGTRQAGEAYRRAELSFLESLADQAALALERALVISDLERRIREMNILTRLAEGVNITLAYDDLLELFFAQTAHLVPTHDFRITLHEEQTQEIAHALLIEKDERLTQLERIPLPAGAGLEGEVIRSQRAIVTTDYERECRTRGLLPNISGIHAWLGVPLNAGAKTIGALSLGNRNPGASYTLEQVNVVQAIANLAAGALMKTQLLEEMELRARQMSSLNEISRSLSSTLELQLLLDRIVQSAMDILNCEAGSLLLVDENTGESVFKVAVGPVGADLIGQRVPAGAGLVGKAVASRLPIIQNDVRRSAEWFNTDQRTGYATQDLLVVPMQVKERVVGVLEMLNKHDGSIFTLADQELLTAFASQTAVAIENARLYTLTDQALAARVEELSAMQWVDRELNTSLDVERAMRITLEWAARHAKAEAGLVGLVGEDGVRVIDALGYLSELEAYPEKVVPLEMVALRQAIEGGQPQLSTFSDLPPEGARDAAISGLLKKAQAQAIIPIWREGKTIGILLLESVSSDTFSPETMAFLSRLGDHAAIAISNAQLYAAVQAANRAKSVFVSAVAHELKNPLTAIKGYSDLLTKGMVGPVNEGQTNFLNTIHTNAERMSTLISDLQDVSRIETGQLRLKFSAVPLSTLLDEVVRSFSRQIEEKGQSLEVVIAQLLPKMWCDRDRLIQILVNLVSNAHKYTPQGRKILVSAEHVPNRWDAKGAPQVIHIAVQDNGIGMTPEDQRKIFQQFFRSDDPKVREVSGTGLGLNITKNLIELQGGRIWFESEYQHGTTFHFTVPVAET